MTTPRVLITGLNGFLSIHVALQFIEKGWIVRGTVRSVAKADETKQLSTIRQHVKDGRVELAIVPSLETGDYSEALRDVDAVAHCASPHHMDGKSWEEYKTPAVQGTVNILEQALLVPSIKAVSIVSSFVAMAPVQEDYTTLAGRRYDETSWHSATEDDCRALDATSANAKVIWYCASKKYAEQAAFQFCKERRPSWSLSTLCPPFIFGPPLEVDSAEALEKGAVGISTSFLYSIFAARGKTIPETNFTSWVDARDIAQAIYITIDQRKAGRYPLSGGSFDPVILARAARKARPDLAHLIADCSETSPSPVERGTYSIDTSRARRDLGIKFRSIEQMVRSVLQRYDTLGITEKAL